MLCPQAETEQDLCPEASMPATAALEPATVVKQKTVEEPQEPQSEAACEEDNNEVDDATEQQTETSDCPEPAKKRVRFDVADVVEFEPTMWTATVSSEGVPLGMSVDVRRRTKRPLESYEYERVSQRVDRQEYMEFGYLEPEERLDILENAGHSISIISHVERDTLRINRERWESNEYDLMYQYGLGEVPLMEDGDMEMLQEDGDDIMHVDDSSDDDFFFGGSSRNMVVDAEVRFSMEDMDAYDAINTHTYDDLSIDYASDCILGDNESSDENNELPYAVDSFDSPLSCDLLEMGTSPSDVSSTDCMLAAANVTSCAQSAAATSTSSASSSTEASTVESAPVVAV
ncbi:hypothetical protein P3T76_004899 [Phytophthora citrophthora]|uniref:Uncharacterized protein n=1 Tax=Phytophthora citrophthora TaxID=4793 RepID=A0AAD9GSP1_9STRA|nr:hypothetical protein P3T76_004899 [Phytophthora citrophthora]